MRHYILQIAKIFSVCIDFHPQKIRNKIFIFLKIYRFFPFPYAINAMREAICGTYEMDYAVYLLELLIFAVLAFCIGLLVRKPFIGTNHFVSEKLEETELM